MEGTREEHSTNDSCISNDGYHIWREGVNDETLRAVDTRSGEHLLCKVLLQFLSGKFFRTFQAFQAFRSFRSFRHPHFLSVCNFNRANCLLFGVVAGLFRLSFSFYFRFLSVNVLRCSGSFEEYTRFIFFLLEIFICKTFLCSGSLSE